MAKRFSILCLLGAALLSAAVFTQVPVGSLLALAAGDCDGCEECKVKTTVNATIDCKTGTAGNKSIRDAGEQGIKDAILQGLQAQGLDPNDAAVKQRACTTAKAVMDNDFVDAVTHINVGASWSAQQVDNCMNVTANFQVNVTIVLPAKANKKLTEHENGHKLIWDKAVALANTKFKKEMDKATCDQGSIDAAFNSAFQFVTGVASSAGQKYDQATNHGRKGGPKQQLQQASAAFDAALKEAQGP